MFGYYPTPCDVRVGNISPFCSYLLVKLKHAVVDLLASRILSGSDSSGKSGPHAALHGSLIRLRLPPHACERNVYSILSTLTLCFYCDSAMQGGLTGIGGLCAMGQEGTGGSVPREPATGYTCSMHMPIALADEPDCACGHSSGPSRPGSRPPRGQARVRWHRLACRRSEVRLQSSQAATMVSKKRQPRRVHCQLMKTGCLYSAT